MNNRQILENAIRENDFQTVSHLITTVDPAQAIFPVNSEPGLLLQTPIELAASLGHFETVQAILENTDIRHQAEYQKALFAAVKIKHADIAQLLINAGADVNHHLLCEIVKDRDLKLARFFLEKLKLQNKNYSPSSDLFYITVRNNDHAMIVLLLFFSEKPPGLGENETQTPIQVAYHLGYFDCIKAFANKVTDQDDKAKYHSVLIKAVIAKQYAIVEQLLSADVPQDWNYREEGTCLHVAVRNNDLRMIELLLSYQGYHCDAHQHETYPHPLSPIELAAHLKHWEVVRFFAMKHRAVGSINDISAYCATLMMVIIDNDAPIDLIKLLVEAGAPTDRSFYLVKHNPLSCAVASKDANKIALLLLLGFDRVLQESDGWGFPEIFREGWLRYRDISLLELAFPFLCSSLKGNVKDDIFNLIVSYLWLPGIPLPSISQNQEVLEYPLRKQLSTVSCKKSTFQWLPSLPALFSNDCKEEIESNRVHLTIAIRTNCFEAVAQYATTIRDTCRVGNRNPVCFATAWEHLESVKALIHVWGKSGIDLYTEALPLTKNVDIAQVLVDAGAHVNEKLLEDAVFQNKDVRLCRLFLNKIQEKSFFKYSPTLKMFRDAIREDNSDMIILLLSFTTKPSILRRHHQQPLVDCSIVTWAAMYRRWDCVKAFATRKTDANDSYEYSFAVLEAVKERRYDIVQVLAEAGARTSNTGYSTRDGEKPLHAALKNEDIIMIALLLALGFQLLERSKVVYDIYDKPIPPGISETPDEMAKRLNKVVVLEAGKSMYKDALLFKFISPFLFRALDQPKSAFGKVGDTGVLERIGTFFCLPGSLPPTALSNKNMIAKASAKSILAASNGLFQSHSPAATTFLAELDGIVKNSSEASKAINCSVRKFLKKEPDPESRTMSLLAKFTTISCPKLVEESKTSGEEAFKQLNVKCP